MNSFEKYHSLIFSLISILGLEISIWVYTTSGMTSFLISCAIFLSIFVFEALLSFQFAQNLVSKMPLPDIVDDIKHIHISHHIVLPLLLYICICGFIFFNSSTISSQIIVLLGAVTFFTIFQGQRSSFKSEFLFDETLHYIYDSIKIIIFFLSTYIIVQAQLAYAFNSVFSFIAIEVISFLLFLLIIVRKDQFNSIGILYIFISSILVSSSTILMISHIPALIIGLVASVIFYLLIAIIHHKINATLNASIIIEYIIIALIILLALRGISY